jgi:hypothetical protein
MLLKFRYLLLLAFISFTQYAWSQGQGNSPYNTLGIGEITEESVAAQDMMGGTGVSFANSFYINHINPAMLVKNRTVGLNKYVAFNIGLKGGYKTLNQGNKVRRFWFEHEQPHYGVSCKTKMGHGYQHETILCC